MILTINVKNTNIFIESTSFFGSSEIAKMAILPKFQCPIQQKPFEIEIKFGILS